MNNYSCVHACSVFLIATVVVYTRNCLVPITTTIYGLVHQLQYSVLRVTTSTVVMLPGTKTWSAVHILHNIIPFVATVDVSPLSCLSLSYIIASFLQLAQHPFVRGISKTVYKNMQILWHVCAVRTCSHMYMTVGCHACVYASNSLCICDRFSNGSISMYTLISSDTINYVELHAIPRSQ